MTSKPITTFLIAVTILLLFCKGNKISYIKRPESLTIALVEALPMTVAEISLPPGFKRLDANETSFTQWLRQVKLKKDKTVYLYDGRIKSNQQAQFAVLDISVGKDNLQQCADAVMRIRAEYLFSIHQFEQIIFIDNEAAIYRFTAPYTHEHLIQYLQKVFGMCGTASLSKQMNPVKLEEIQPGDVLLRGGFPGHAVIVMDVAVNNKGQKTYLLAQSYMPAQDIHILKNDANKDGSPWYQITGAQHIETPEYIFSTLELKRW
jgi:hypothetical protein